MCFIKARPTAWGLLVTGIINLKYIYVVEQAGFAKSLKDELGIALLCAMYKHPFFGAPVSEAGQNFLALNAALHQGHFARQKAAFMTLNTSD